MYYIIIKYIIKNPPDHHLVQHFVCGVAWLQLGQRYCFVIGYDMPGFPPSPCHYNQRTRHQPAADNIYLVGVQVMEVTNNK